MVAIASGSSKQMGRWAKALRAAAIGFMIVTPMCPPEVGETNNAELWVSNSDADEARSAIRTADSLDRLMW
jgi:hypothetical protein